jgi:hypothetical protein
MKWFIFAFAAFVSWMLPVACHAGTTGELTGMVTDGLRTNRSLPRGSLLRRRRK